MPKIARVGDIHEGVCNHNLDCCPHSVTGEIIQGSSDVKNNTGIARINDLVEHNCPHCGTGFINEGSSTVFVNGKAISRVGDEVTYPGGSGVIVNGSDDSFAGD